MNDSIVPGVVYIHVGNEIQKLCETSDIHIETLANVPVSCDLPKLTEMETSASFEMVTKISEEAFLILSGKKGPQSEALKSLPLIETKLQNCLMKLNRTFLTFA